MPRALLVTHRSPEQAGGPSARWRSLIRRLPDLGWDVDVISAPQRASAVEFSAAEASRPAPAARRAAVMGRIASLTDPVFALAGVKPDAMPLSTLWIGRGTRDVRRALHSRHYDAIVATGPPMAGPLAAALGLSSSAPPLVVELRDLWAGSPAFDRGGRLLPAIEHGLLGRAARVVVMTPEAAADVAARHPEVTGRLTAIPNGFEPGLLERRTAPPGRGAARPLTILHSGTLTPERPLLPLLRAMAGDDRFRLVLHGFVHPEILATVQENPHVEVHGPGSWDEAVNRMLEADACLVTQASGAGDGTAVASKVYEYLAVGRPVLCITDGGATDALLRRLGAQALCARLDDEQSIRNALHRLADDPPPPLSPEVLAPFSRAQIAADVAVLLGDVAAGS